MGNSRSECIKEGDGKARSDLVTSRDLEGSVNTGRPDWNKSALQMATSMFVQVA